MRDELMDLFIQIAVVFVVSVAGIILTAAIRWHTPCWEQQHDLLSEVRDFMNPYPPIPGVCDLMCQKYPVCIIDKAE